jgi:hypothetical protein
MGNSLKKRVGENHFTVHGWEMDCVVEVRTQQN